MLMTGAVMAGEAAMAFGGAKGADWWAFGRGLLILAALLMAWPNMTGG
jgi:hypothetical protein